LKDTIKARIDRDPEYREALLREAVRCIATGDTATGNAISQLCGARPADRPS
jgi:hypothetical protein